MGFKKKAQESRWYIDKEHITTTKLKRIPKLNLEKMFITLDDDEDLLFRCKVGMENKNNGWRFLQQRWNMKNMRHFILYFQTQKCY